MLSRKPGINSGVGCREAKKDGNGKVAIDMDSYQCHGWFNTDMPTDITGLSKVSRDEKWRHYGANDII